MAILRGLLMIACLVFFVGFLLVAKRTAEDLRDADRANPAAPYTPPPPVSTYTVLPDSVRFKREVRVTAVTLRSVGYAGKVEADLTIKNGNPVLVKDIAIACDVNAKSGTRIQTFRQTIYDVIPASSTRKFRSVSLGYAHDQAHTLTCDIDEIKL